MNSWQKTKQLQIDSKYYNYFDIQDAAKALNLDILLLPFSIRVLFENILRNYDGITVTKKDLESIVHKYNNQDGEYEISFFPARVLMQDFTGVPAIVDLAAMRETIANQNGDPQSVNPQIPVDLVIDHSVQVDKYGDNEAFKFNTEIEFQRNEARYAFLKWGQKSLNNFRVVPPGTGICHQVNLEYLSQVVFVNKETLYPDTLVGTDSHTTMVNALGILGWGVGGIEAEAAMLGEPLSMLLPKVVGIEFIGALQEGVTATELVLAITHKLRTHGVVGKFVEFYGSGLKNLSLADRATISNMAPEYGATCGYFPIDNEVINYLQLSGRNQHNINICKEYAAKQLLWYDDTINHRVQYDEKIIIHLHEISLSIAGPTRPQDNILLQNVATNFSKNLATLNKNPTNLNKKINGLKNGSIVIAAITSCTNTSNPFAMIAAGLLAKKAVNAGLSSCNHVKTSFAPGSQVVTEYLQKADLQQYFDKLGFNLVGYGCTTCIGNSGPLKPEITGIISKEQLVVASILSGNRNFEGRIHPLVRANYLASPLLCVAYAITGDINVDLFNEQLGIGHNGKPVFLKDIMPTNAEVQTVIAANLDREMFVKKYNTVFDGDMHWQQLKGEQNTLYNWYNDCTYIKKPPYFHIEPPINSHLNDIKKARILAILGDSITTDHISPAGNIADNSPAAQYLIKQGVNAKNFNSYGARRGNHEVMVRGTFANSRIKNKMLSGIEGGYTLYNNEIIPIYDAAMHYDTDSIPLVLFAGKEYGTGSSRDWAAKGTFLLGIRAVIAESFERIHRSNLIGMGVIPLQLQQSVDSLSLTGNETIEILGLNADILPKQKIQCTIDNNVVELILRADTEREIEYLKQGGIMQYVVSKKLGTGAKQ